MVTESPLAMPSQMTRRDRELDPYRSDSAPPLLHSNGTVIQNGPYSYMSEELRSDLAYHPYHPSVNLNLNPMLPQPQPRQLRKDWRVAYRSSNGGNLGVGGVRDGRRPNQEGREGNGSGFCFDDGLVRLPPGSDVGNPNALGEIFQDAFSYPNPSPAAGLNSNIIDANISASSNGSGSSASNNYGSILGSPLSKNGSPDPEIAMRVPSPGIPPIGVKLNSVNRRMTTNGSSTFSNASSGMDRTNQIISAFSALNLQQGTDAYHSSSISRHADHTRSYVELDRDNTAHSPISRNFTYLPEYVPENIYTGLNMNGAPCLFEQTDNDIRTSIETSWLYRRYVEHLETIQDADPAFRQARQQQMMHQERAYSGDHVVVPGYMLDSVFPSLPTGDQIRPGDCGLMRCPSGLRKLSSFSNHIPTLLEEFKSNKTRCYELSEIAGHVVEFSSDQYGSRFIQQKLETATAAEKDMVFAEIMPHALSLMTDVFGNYVVQKFFEHGSSAQIKELAKQLNGRVLSLSLQMYGCRVIQKAIEVVDLEQQTQMVAELENHVMRCVRDQNGNHVIQKCIECVPQKVIHFIISTFYGQVLVLSTHAYGCRVIQRVLEHCNNPKTQQAMMDEILDNVLLLSQDQYGNYVVQHVLEHGKPNEKSAIIEMLAGQIVNMSRQKYASNVVEKCLSFGTPVERQILIAEMLGPTEENEALQEMMKDQFGNYVVQKVLETCSDQQREMILTRIKIHLTALKKYTYGKHIVARVEKLVAAGERRIAIQSGASASTA